MRDCARASGWKIVPSIVQFGPGGSAPAATEASIPYHVAGFHVAGSRCHVQRGHARLGDAHSLVSPVASLSFSNTA